MTSKIPTAMKAKEGLWLITADAFRKNAVYIIDIHRVSIRLYILPYAKTANGETCKQVLITLLSSIINLAPANNSRN
mgnify:CR=1 FL=1